MEQFTDVLLDGRVYSVEFTGTYRYSWSGLWNGSGSAEADAAYRTDNLGNFSRENYGLLVDGARAKTMDSWKEDRCQHRYTALIEGKGQRVAFRIEPGSNWDSSSGELTVAVELLPAGTQTEAMRRAAAAAQAAQAAKAAPQPQAPQPAQPSWPTDRLDIPACGSEICSPVLTAGTVYRLLFSGCYSYVLHGYQNETADAAYTTMGRDKTFNTAYNGLYVDGNYARSQDSWQEDRTNHWYTCLIEGKGKRVKFKLYPLGDSADKGLTVTFEAQPAGTKTAAALEREIAEQKEKAAKAAEVVALRSQRVAELKRMVSHQRNLLDPAYRKSYLEQFGQDILTEFRGQWEKEYDDVFGDKELLAALTQDAPEVLRWYQARNGMILAAERAAVMPASTAPAPMRQITPSTMPYVSQVITELFQFTEVFDRHKLALAQDRNPAAHRPIMDNCSRGLQFYYEQLRLFGIHARTPEEAEQQYFRLCPPPAPTYYEQLMTRIRAGESAGWEPIRSRIEDLYREDLKLHVQRKRAVERKSISERDAIDQQLVAERKERGELTDFLKSINVAVEFKDYRDQEASLLEELKNLIEEKSAAVKLFEAQNDPEGAEAIKNLYAEQQAKLFEQDTASYT